MQVVNQPIVRGTVTIQNPASTHANLGSALVDIYSTRGVAGLWHGFTTWSVTHSNMFEAHLAVAAFVVWIGFFESLQLFFAPDRIAAWRLDGQPPVRPLGSALRI